MERPAFKLNRTAGTLEVTHFATLDTNEPCIMPSIMHALELSKQLNGPVLISWKPEMPIPVDIKLFVFHNSCEYKLAHDAMTELKRQLLEDAKAILIAECQPQVVRISHVKSELIN